MTLEQWWQKVSGWEITIPKGTDLTKYVGHTRILNEDTKVLITVDASEIKALVKKAIRNTSRQSRDGALLVKLIKGGATRNTTKQGDPVGWTDKETTTEVPAHGEAERCPSTLVPGDPDVRCILPKGHEGSHQDHILPKRRWTGD